MTILSLEAKEAIVCKALNRGGKSLDTIAIENNIGSSTLSKWMKLKREGKPLIREQRGRAGHGHRSPLNHLLESHNLDEHDLNAYCRENGIYQFQLQEWKAKLMQQPEDLEPPISKNALKALRKENFALKRELRKKDKALAEAAALLILKKKAGLIWGEDEED